MSRTKNDRGIGRVRLRKSCAEFQAVESQKKNKMSDCVPYKRSYAVSPRTRAPKKSLSVPRSLCCSTFDRVGRQKTPREASRARARLGRRQRRCRAWVSKCRSVDLRRRRPRSAPLRRIGEMASDAAPALNGQTHANIGADAEVSPATPAVKDRIDRPEVPGTCLSLRILEGTSGSPPRPAAVGTPPVRSHSLRRARVRSLPRVSSFVSVGFGDPSR